MAATNACYDYTNNVPSYSGTCNPGAEPYAGDVANIITLDTPHNGSSLAGSWEKQLSLSADINVKPLDDKQHRLRPEAIC